MANTDQGKEPRENFEPQVRDFLNRCPEFVRKLILLIPTIAKKNSNFQQTLKTFLPDFELSSEARDETQRRSFSWVTLGNKAFLFIAGALLVLQFAYLTGLGFKLMQPQTIALSSYGPDASQAIDTAVRTNLVNDNGWYPYGPVYYRLAYIARWITPNISDLATPEDQLAQRAHLSLMVVSLISLYGIAFFLVAPLTRKPAHRLIGTLVLVSVMLNRELWIGNVYFNGHPEVLLSFVAILFIHFLFLALQHPDKNHLLVISALIAGIGFSTKISFMLLYPALVFLFCPPFNIKSSINMVKFAVIAIAGYFAAGFPQNFKVHKIFWFLNLHSTLDTESSFSSFLAWWQRLITEGWSIALILFVLFVLFRWGEPDRETLLTPANRNRLIALTTLPFLMLTFMNWAGAPVYYLMPFMVVLFLGMSIISSSLPPSFMPCRMPETWVKPVRLSGVILLVIVIHNQVGLVPHSLESSLKDKLEQTQQTQVIYSRINRFIKKGKVMLYDPYIPFPRSAWKDDHVLRESTLENYFNVGKGDVLLFSSSWHTRFWKKQPDDWDLAGVGEKEWWAMHNFYSTFKGKQRVIDSRGQTWEKTYSDNHNNEIWERVIAAQP